MSTDLADTIIPDTFFYSVFRNMTDHSIYVPWAGSHGMNIPAGEHFRIIGDPRIPPSIPKAHGVVECIRRMLQAKLIEYCSSPGQIVDNNRPDGRSLGLFSKDGDPYLDAMPLSREELATRTLPTITPTCTYDDVKSEILVDWSALTTLEIHDAFTVLVTLPEGTGKPKLINCGSDKLTRYAVKAGPGDYKFTVTITGVDGRTQEGTEVVVNVPVV